MTALGVRANGVADVCHRRRPDFFPFWNRRIVPWHCVISAVAACCTSYALHASSFSGTSSAVRLRASPSGTKDARVPNFGTNNSQSWLTPGFQHRCQVSVRHNSTGTLPVGWNRSADGRPSFLFDSAHPERVSSSTIHHPPSTPHSTYYILPMSQVRDVIEAERFMTPRISLPAANGEVAASRSNDGNSFLFEVLGAGRSESGQQAAPAPAENSLGVPSRGGSTSLETCPPPALDPRRWTEAVGSDFMVRGASYLTTRVKVPSARQVRFFFVSAFEFGLRGRAT